MKKLSVSLTFAYEADQKSYRKEFDVEDDFDLKHSEYLSRQAFDEVRIDLLSATYRATLPEFGSFIDKMNWFAPTAGISDLTRFAAYENTAQVWWQIQNSFTESAQLLSRARAYDDVENGESNQDRRMYLHLMKIQYFNAAAFLISKIEDWFLLLLFVNSGCSLVRGIDVHSPGWMKEIQRGPIAKGLKARKAQLCCATFRRSNPYLDALSDEDYRTIRSVFKKIGRPKVVATIRNYRNEIAHRGLPAVDVADLSPDFKFPVKQGSRISVAVSASAPIDYKFLNLYENAVGALKHMETELLRLKKIPVLEPSW
jgi:hypothetical protein